MRVKELIKQLKAHDQNAEVFLSPDPEGNGIRKICEVATYEKGDFEPVRTGETEDPIMKGQKLVVKGNLIVIWPTDEIVSD
jgi:hypothetical protein